ncbi:MAG: hypothetical protein PUP91_10850 [Rhizonema sp. PD37]|nr:hypothetical protein [Rhizonema sp. PD37]
MVSVDDSCSACGCEISRSLVLEESEQHSLEKEDSSLTDSLTIVLEESEQHSLEKEYSGLTDSPAIVLEETQLHSLEKIFEQKAPQETNSHIQVISSSSGSLYRYLKNVKLKSGEIASYPRVSAVRDPDNLKHWYWGYNYKVLEDGSWKTKSHSVQGVRVVGVRRMIENNAPIAAIRAFIKVLEDDLSNSLEKEIDEIESHSQEKVLEDGSSNSLERPLASGSLYRYLKNKKLKSGAIASYPRVEGVRDLNNPNHWYWGYSYEVLQDGEWKGRSLSVKAHKVSAVQAMIDSHKPVSTIKAFIEGSPAL